MQVFPERASSLVPGLPGGFDGWIESLCRFRAAERPSAADALAAFQNLYSPVVADSVSSTSEPAAPPLDYTNLYPELC